ncbi:hypothetical protein [Geobacter sulfurreducens]|nr:hypothetical protein [Geobacter sulfurreducens]HML79769.1 hypothetical protein [Geobacter sulfurreducens]
MSRFNLPIPGLGELDRQIAKIRDLRDALQRLNTPAAGAVGAASGGA